MSATTVSSGALGRTDAVGKTRASVLHRFLFFAVVLVAVVLRLVNLGSQSYWGDEDATVRLMKQSLWHMFRYGIVGSETTPPLYYFIAALWTRAFGTGEFALRSLSAFVGVATVAVVYTIGVELRSRRAGLIGAAFVSLSPLMVWYSQDARAYSLFILLTSVALLFFTQALRTESSRSIWLWAVASALALTAHYFAFFVVFPEAVVLLALRRTRPRAVRPTVLVAAVGLALVPLFLDQSSKTEHTSWISFVDLRTRLEMTLQWFVTGRWDLSLGLLVVGALAVALIIGLGFVSGRKSERELMVLGVGASSVLVPIVGGLVGFDYVYDRYLVAAWVPFAVVLAATLAAWKRVGTLLAIVLCGCALGASVKVAATPALQRADWRQAAAKLSTLPSGTLGVLYPGFEIGALQVYGRGVSIVWSPWSATPAPARTILTRRVTILAENPWSPTAAHTLLFHLPAGFHQTGETSFSSFVLITYSAARAQPVAIDRLTSMRPSGYLVGSTPWGTTVFRERATAA